VDRGQTQDGAYVITLSRSLVEPFITFSERRDLREKAWKLWTTRGWLWIDRVCHWCILLLCTNVEGCCPVARFRCDLRQSLCLVGRRCCGDADQRHMLLSLFRASLLLLNMDRCSEQRGISAAEFLVPAVGISTSHYPPHN
jgi:hypothetical protein